MPLRILMVTGTPYGLAASTAARTMSVKSCRFQGSAAPPPLRVTLGTGQPKFRSTWSARSSPAMILTAAPTVAGSTPYTWAERGFSSSPNVTIRSASTLRSTSARLVTISATYSPGSNPVDCPASRHSVRKARFVTPAMGASTTGVATVMGPICRGLSRAVVVSRAEVTVPLFHRSPRASLVVAALTVIPGPGPGAHGSMSQHIDPLI